MSVPLFVAQEVGRTLSDENVWLPTVTIDATLEGDNKVNANEDNDVVVSGTTSGVEDEIGRAHV